MVDSTSSSLGDQGRDYSSNPPLTVWALLVTSPTLGWGLKSPSLKGLQGLRMRDQILSHCSTCSGNSKSLESCEPESMDKCQIYVRKVYWVGYPDDHIYVCLCSVTQSCPTLCYPMDCNPPGSLSMEFSRQEYWSRVLVKDHEGLEYEPQSNSPSCDSKDQIVRQYCNLETHL